MKRKRGVITLVSDKVELKPRSIKIFKEHLIMFKATIDNEDITATTIYEPNNSNNFH